MLWRDVEITFEDKASLFDLGLRSAFYHVLPLWSYEEKRYPRLFEMLIK